MNKLTTGILLIIGVIVIILFINIYVYFVKERYNKVPYYFYRLGDMIKNKRWRDRHDGRKKHYKLFPNSIATKYMKLTDKDNDYLLLN